MHSKHWLDKKPQTIKDWLGLAFLCLAFFTLAGQAGRQGADECALGEHQGQSHFLIGFLYGLGHFSPCAHFLLPQGLQFVARSVEEFREHGVFVFDAEPFAQFAAFDADERHAVPRFGMELPACHHLFGCQAAERRRAIDFLHEVPRRGVQRGDAPVVNDLDGSQAVGLRPLDNGQGRCIDAERGKA